jgi:hypothetical protein
MGSTLAGIRRPDRLRIPDVRFDLDRFKAITDRLRWDDLDLGSFAEQPLAPEARRCLRYMHDVEYHTACYLRDLLSTRAHDDPRLTGFLTFWNYEEFWHGEAIAAVLRAHGEPAGDERIEALRHRLGWKVKISPAVWSIGSLFMKGLPAVHMTWGAVNEWTTQAGYARLAARAGHPVLTELLHRIMRQEGRHIDFYASEAAHRLESSRGARTLTRLALRRAWTPVGAGVMPDEEVTFMTGYLFDNDEGRKAAARIDRHIDRLPGLAGLRLIANGIDAYSDRRYALPSPARSPEVLAAA